MIMSEGVIHPMSPAPPSSPVPAPALPPGTPPRPPETPPRPPETPPPLVGGSKKRNSRRKKK